MKEIARGNGFGRGKRYLTRASERPWRWRQGATDVRAWGRRMAPRGLWFSPN